MKYRTKEFLVGTLVLVAVALMLVFGWLMGVLGPFRKEVQYHLLYSFAGGVEVGSPVRVSGVKVGKVESIEFIPLETAASSDRATLRVTVGVSKVASQSVRQDSQFYVNMAGLIGERYIEISPGTGGSPVLASGATVRGMDPPRIDQLLSQGYGVFGRIQQLLEQNEKPITEFMKQFTALLNDANQLLQGRDRRRFVALLDNLLAVTGDLKTITSDLTDPTAKEIFGLLSDLVRRAHTVDKQALKRFLQEEGIRARIF